MNSIIFADRVIDGSGNAPLISKAVIIENGLISKICDQSEINDIKYPNYKLLHTNGGTLLPGFIEMHSHIHVSAEEEAYDHSINDSDEVLLMRGTKAVRAALLSGVTTMRDLGSKNNIIFPIKKSVESGIIPGPTLLAAGTPITTTGGHCNMFGTEADSKEDVIKAIRSQFKLGADWIKIIATGGNFTPNTNIREPQYDSDILISAVNDASRLGLSVAAHCHATEGIRNSVRAGIRNLIHCSWISSNPQQYYDYDTDLADEIAALGIYVDPTLALSHLNSLRNKNPDKPIRNTTERFEILRDMWDRGIKFVTGMDSGMINANFDDFAYIPEVMVNKMGISPLEAITCATKTSAECLNLIDQIGTIDINKKADLVVVNGDPSKDISTLHKVKTIMKNGDLIKLDGEILI
jgi:imidazolonepropionase-like amidohydrolase